MFVYEQEQAVQSSAPVSLPSAPSLAVTPVKAPSHLQDYENEVEHRYPLAPCTGEVRNYITTATAIATPTATAVIADTSLPPESENRSWLAVRLRELGTTEEQINHCEKILVHKEGFASEESFAIEPVEGLTREYLLNCGIVVKGTINQLLYLHQLLRPLHCALPNQIRTSDNSRNTKQKEYHIHKCILS